MKQLFAQDDLPAGEVAIGFVTTKPRPLLYSASPCLSSTANEIIIIVIAQNHLFTFLIQSICTI